MTIFDQFVLSIFNYYKARFKRKANAIAVFYISVLQIALLLVLGVFFAVFFKQMHVETMSSSKAWTIFIIVWLFVYFKNWMSYTGKKRNILNAKNTKRKSQQYSVLVLWLLPLGCIALSWLLYKML